MPPIPPQIPKTLGVLPIIIISAQDNVVTIRWLSVRNWESPWQSVISRKLIIIWKRGSQISDVSFRLPKPRYFAVGVLTQWYEALLPNRMGSYSFRSWIVSSNYIFHCNTHTHTHTHTHTNTYAYTQTNTSMDVAPRYVRWIVSESFRSFRSLKQTSPNVVTHETVFL